MRVVRLDRLDIKSVLSAVALLTLYPFVIAATHQSFWQHRDMGPVIPVLAVLLVIALVLRRRWAWGLLLLVFAAATMRTVATGDVTTAGTCVIAIALLASPVMRRHVRLGADG